MDALQTDAVQLDAARIDSGADARVELDATADAPQPDTGSPVLDGIWVSTEELAALPTSGDAWDALLEDAQALAGSADLSDQDSNHDVATMAAALVCTRTGEECDAARSAVMSAVGTEVETLTTPRVPAENQWLPIGRNLAAYVISADLLGLRDDGIAGSEGARFENWVRGFVGRVGSEGEAFVPFRSGSNASSQEGFVFAAVAAYLRDDALLAQAWDAFRRVACDESAPDRLDIDLRRGVEFEWAHDDDLPCGINPSGSEKVVAEGRNGAGSTHDIGGVIINDMRRGGEYEWPPGYTQYPWVGLEGLVPAAVVLSRRGFPAFEIAERAILRSALFLRDLALELGQDLESCDGTGCWWDYDRARSVKHLLGAFYDMDLPYESPAGSGRTMGYADWTHPR